MAQQKTPKGKWQKIGELFIVKNEGEGPKQPKATPRPAPSFTPTLDQQPATVPEGEFDDQLYAVLSEALKKANTPEIDYYEFKVALTNLAKKGAAMSLDQRYIAAFFSLQGAGEITKESLLKSISAYKQVLAGEEKRFQESVEQQSKQVLGKAQERLDAAKQKKESVEDRIKGLQAELEKAQKEVPQAEEDIKAAQQEFSTLNQKKEGKIASFNKTLATIVGGMEEDEKNITTFIPE